MTSKTRETSASPSRGASGGEESGEHLRETAGELATDVKETATLVADTARREATRKVESQRQRAAGELGEMANAMRQTSSQLRQQQTSSMPNFIDKAADQVERVSGYLENATLGDMVGRVEGFARREPFLFLGGAFAVGLLGARLLKASSPKQRQYGMSEPSGNFDYRADATGGSTGQDYARSPSSFAHAPGYATTSSLPRNDAANDPGFDARTTAANWPPRQAAPKGGG